MVGSITGSESVKPLNGSAVVLNKQTSSMQSVILSINIRFIAVKMGTESGFQWVVWP